MLLVGTGLFVRSLERVRELPLGIQPANVLMADLRTTGMPLSGEQIGALYERLHRAAVQVPGIEGAAIASSLPFHSTYAMRVRVPGRDSLPRIADGGPYYTAATTDYFKVMGMRILRGRGFEPGDQEGSRVVIVNESMAKLWWPGRDALGQCMTIGADTMPCSRVVGIVENPRRQSVIEDMTLQYFIPLPHGQTNSRVLVLRSQTDPTKAAERIRMALQRADPNLPYVRVRPLEELIAPQTQSWRLGARMFSAFGVLSLILAGIGLYGMLAYDVSQRTRELGIRVALGATGREIAAVVVGQGMKLLLAGLIIGLGLALISGRFIEKLLFQTSPSDPIVLSGVVVVLGLVGLVAMVAPTVRATRADPLRALRAD
jgi:predicted permease